MHFISLYRRSNISLDRVALTVVLLAWPFAVASNRLFHCSLALLIVADHLFLLTLVRRDLFDRLLMSQPPLSHTDNAELMAMWSQFVDHLRPPAAPPRAVPPANGRDHQPHHQQHSARSAADDAAAAQQASSLHAAAESALRSIRSCRVPIRSTAAMVALFPRVATSAVIDCDANTDADGDAAPTHSHAGGGSHELHPSCSGLWISLLQAWSRFRVSLPTVAAAADPVVSARPAPKAAALAAGPSSSSVAAQQRKPRRAGGAAAAARAEHDGADALADLSPIRPAPDESRRRGAGVTADAAAAVDRDDGDADDDDDWWESDRLNDAVSLTQSIAALRAEQQATRQPPPKKAPRATAAQRVAAAAAAAAPVVGAAAAVQTGSPLMSQRSRATPAASQNMSSRHIMFDASQANEGDSESAMLSQRTAPLTSQPPADFGLRLPQRRQRSIDSALGSQTVDVTAAADVPFVPRNVPPRVTLARYAPQAIHPHNHQHQHHQGAAPFPAAAARRVVVCIDSRESRAEQMISTLVDDGCPVVRAMLPVGDFLFLVRIRDDDASSTGGGAADPREFVVPVVIERKREDDLRQSIVDARYDVQRWFMRRAIAVRRILVVEGADTGAGGGAGVGAVGRGGATWRGGRGGGRGGMAWRGGRGGGGGGGRGNASFGVWGGGGRSAQDALEHEQRMHAAALSATFSTALGGVEDAAAPERDGTFRVVMTKDVAATAALIGATARVFERVTARCATVGAVEAALRRFFDGDGADIGDGVAADAGDGDDGTRGMGLTQQLRTQGIAAAEDFWRRAPTLAAKGGAPAPPRLSQASQSAAACDGGASLQQPPHVAATTAACWQPLCCRERWFAAHVEYRDAVEANATFPRMLGVLRGMAPGVALEIAATFRCPLELHRGFVDAAQAPPPPPPPDRGLPPRAGRTGIGAAAAALAGAELAPPPERILFESVRAGKARTSINAAAGGGGGDESQMSRDASLLGLDSGAGDGSLHLLDHNSSGRLQSLMARTASGASALATTAGGGRAKQLPPAQLALCRSVHNLFCASRY